MMKNAKKNPKLIINGISVIFSVCLPVAVVLYHTVLRAEDVQKRWTEILRLCPNQRLWLVEMHTSMGRCSSR